jgi:hypothetical protein
MTIWLTKEQIKIIKNHKLGASQMVRNLIEDTRAMKTVPSL